MNATEFKTQIDTMSEEKQEALLLLMISRLKDDLKKVKAVCELPAEIPYNEQVRMKATIEDVTKFAAYYFNITEFFSTAVHNLNPPYDSEQKKRYVTFSNILLEFLNKLEYEK